MNRRLPSEAIQEKDKSINFSLTKFQAIVTGIVALLTVIIPGVISYQTNINTRFIENKRLELPADALRDSIKDVNREQRYKRETELALSNYIQVHKVMYKLKNMMRGSNHVTIWKIHDHGGILNTAEQQYVTVLYSVSSENFYVDIKGDWQKRDLYLGDAWFANKLRKVGYHLMPDVELEDDYFIGETKSYSKLIGDRAIVGMYIKSEANAMYYLTAGFPTTNPQFDIPLMNIKLLNSKSRLVELIQEASTQLNTKRNDY